MMKKNSKFVLAIVFVWFTAGAAFAADVANIGIVDLQEILQKSDSGKAAQGEITTYGNKLKEDFDARQKEVEDLKNDLERESFVIDKGQREDREREIRIKINDIKTLQRKYTQELKEYEAKLVKEIHKDIVDVIESLGKKEGFLLIIERSAALYYPKTIDITDKVIEAYNKTYSKKNKDK